MAMNAFPYSYYRCSCTAEREQRRLLSLNGAAAPATIASLNDAAELEEDQDETFDPSNLRSNFCLYPLENLMWCDSCYDIRCNRCTVEEIVCYYCPNCLFEVPSTTVRSEGNRCTRNCFNCPECTTQLSINSLDPDPNSTAGPYILMCNYCHWSSMDVGLKFNNPRSIYQHLLQLSGVGSGGTRQPSQRLSSRFLETVPEPDSKGPEGRQRTSRDVSPSNSDAHKPQGAIARFQALKGFYKAQLNSAYPSDNPFSSEINYSSPSHISRVLAMYSSNKTGNKFGAGAKQTLMREAAEASEGLQLFSPDLDAAKASKLQSEGWAMTATLEQKHHQLGAGTTGGGADARFLSDLKPVATLLRTKRSSRCRTCKHILVKPEAKISKTSYRIKLAASEHVPKMMLRPLAIGVNASAVAPTDQAGLEAIANLDLNALPPSRTLQFLLKVTNPNFETGIRVTLATPREAPGTGSRVTILCPQFEIGANMDVWDEALRGEDGIADRSRAATVTSGGGASGAAGASGGPGMVAEAGKVWERGRNWTSVVVEVVPRRLQKPTHLLDEDEAVLEIPIFVRLEYVHNESGHAAGAGTGGTGAAGRDGASSATNNADTAAATGAAAPGGERNDAATAAAAASTASNAAAKAKGQLSYWAVLGVGRIATDDNVAAHAALSTPTAAAMTVGATAAVGAS